MRIATIITGAALVFSATAMARDDQATLRISGAPDTRVRYACEFARGGHDAGAVTPPFTETWPVSGLSCQFEIQDGIGEVRIRLDTGGNTTQASLASPGSLMRLSQNMPQ
jgi:hypothetical protein